MHVSCPYISALNAFADQFNAQLAHAGVPSSEHAVHFCLALGFQAAYNFSPGAIVFEWPVGRARIDLHIAPFDLAVEVKFWRPIPSDWNVPATQLFGGLLADFNKLAHTATSHRLVVFVSDSRGIRYLQRSGRGLLPLGVRSSTVISVADVEGLPKTAAKGAIADGPWQALMSELVWEHDTGTWHLRAWLVSPVTAAGGKG